MDQKGQNSFMRTLNNNSVMGELAPGSVLPPPSGTAFERSLERLVGRGAATRIITKAGVHGAYHMSCRELAEVAAIPMRAAERVTAAREFAFAQDAEDAPVVRTPFVATAHLPPELATLEIEVLLGLVMGSRYELKATVLLSKGSASSTSFCMKDVFVPLIRMNAFAFVLCHNHPSKTPTPSEDDILMTNRVAEVGDIVGVPLLDHLIVAGAEVLSFSALGLLPDPDKDDEPPSHRRPRRRR